MAVCRICDNTQEVCIYIWLLVQRRGERAGVVDVGCPLSSLGSFRKMPEPEVVPRVLMEDPWWHLAEHPSKWWDNRSSKKNLRAPDFKHKVLNKGLWIDNLQTLDWA